MTINSEIFQQQKLAWLSSQVNVDFPTPESIKGRDIYLKQPAKEAEQHPVISATLPDPISVLLVTEHRLTIRWAIVVASQWHNKQEHDEVLEFLTQIDLSDDYQLFVALDGITPVAACLVRVLDDTAYISDVAITCDAIDEAIFLSSVMAQISTQFATTFDYYIKNSFAVTN